MHVRNGYDSVFDRFFFFLWVDVRTKRIEINAFWKRVSMNDSSEFVAFFPFCPY